MAVDKVDIGHGHSRFAARQRRLFGGNFEGFRKHEFDCTRSTMTGPRTYGPGFAG